MAAKRHQHQTPRFLLRRFAVDDHVTRVHRTEPRKDIGTRAAAAGAHFYSYRSASGGRSTEIEDFLQRVDSAAAITIARLAKDDEPVQPQAEQLAEFLAFQVVRTARFRSIDLQAAKAVGPILAAYDTLRSEYGPSAAAWETPAARKRLDQVKADPPLMYRQRPRENSHVRVMLQYGPPLVPSLVGLRWAVGRSDHPAFCTSDNPVLHFRTDGDQTFRGIRIAPTSEIRFALDPHHVLVGAPAHLGPDRFEASGELIRTTNEGLARECDQAVFHRPGFPVVGVNDMRPSAPPLPPPPVEIRRRSDLEPPVAPVVSDPHIQAIIDRLTAGDDQLPPEYW